MDDDLRRAIERLVPAGGGAQWRHVGASGFGDAWSVDAGGRRHFVKIASQGRAEMIDCEADGLRALAGTGAIRVPRIVASGSTGSSAFLVLEWLDVAGPAQAMLGRSLAQLHRAQPPQGPHGERFGWHRDNWIGATLQVNTWSDDWCAFFRDQRLAPQLARAADNGHRGLQHPGGELLAALPTLLGDHRPVPSLVHGDLWSGNAATLRDGDGAVFDPAVYVGDREVDLAMIELFGGFDPGFRDAYEARWPLDDGYPLRRDVYNCYHLLNHLNLFGSGYLSRVQSCIATLLAATR